MPLLAGAGAALRRLRAAILPFVSARPPPTKRRLAERRGPTGYGFCSWSYRIHTRGGSFCRCGGRVCRNCRVRVTAWPRRGDGRAPGRTGRAPGGLGTMPSIRAGMHRRAACAEIASIAAANRFAAACHRRRCARAWVRPCLRRGRHGRTLAPAPEPTARARRASTTPRRHASALPPGCECPQVGSRSCDRPRPGPGLTRASRSRWSGPTCYLLCGAGRGTPTPPTSPAPGVTSAGGDAGRWEDGVRADAGRRTARAARGQRGHRRHAHRAPEASVGAGRAPDGDRDRPGLQQRPGPGLS